LLRGGRHRERDAEDRRKPLHSNCHDELLIV
jgi:hypothetical protein